MTVTVEPVVFDDLAKDVSAAVGAILANEREHRQVTYRELVEQTHISRATLDRMFKGTAEIEVGELVLICTTLGLDPRSVMRDAWNQAMQKRRD